ncbi:hypothetical protein S40288_10594 [Stachybotrys chartarum IBT 40288]|nr:hypothetical protein S40288_10594 [Stachybotrys chartarum IBT 40288]
MSFSTEHWSEVRPRDRRAGRFVGCLDNPADADQRRAFMKAYFQYLDSSLDVGGMETLVKEATDEACRRLAAAGKMLSNSQMLHAVDTVAWLQFFTRRLRTANVPRYPWADCYPRSDPGLEEVSQAQREWANVHQDLAAAQSRVFEQDQREGEKIRQLRIAASVGDDAGSSYQHRGLEACWADAATRERARVASKAESTLKPETYRDHREAEVPMHLGLENLDVRGIAMLESERALWKQLAAKWGLGNKLDIFPFVGHFELPVPQGQEFQDQVVSDRARRKVAEVFDPKITVRIRSNDMEADSVRVSFKEEEEFDPSRKDAQVLLEQHWLVLVRWVHESRVLPVPLHKWLTVEKRDEAMAASETESRELMVSFVETLTDSAQ